MSDMTLFSLSIYTSNDYCNIIKISLLKHCQSLLTNASSKGKATLRKDNVCEFKSFKKLILNPCYLLMIKG